MFRPHIWEIIHNRFKGENRFKDENHLRWNNDMSAADWWIQGAFGDAFARDDSMVWDGPVRSSFAGFLQRLHRAYNGDLNYFADHDEWSWYQEWVRPFHDPLSQDYIKGELSGVSPYTDMPEDYFGNLRLYMENEAPAEWFANVHPLWDWKPPVEDVFQAAINKQVI